MPQELPGDLGVIPADLGGKMTLNAIPKDSMLVACTVRTTGRYRVFLVFLGGIWVRRNGD